MVNTHNTSQYISNQHHVLESVSNWVIFPAIEVLCRCQMNRNSIAAIHPSGNFRTWKQGVYKAWLMIIDSLLKDDSAFHRRICMHMHICHDDAIKWKYFQRYWPFVREIHRWPVNSSHKGQWRGALMFSLICALNKQLSKLSGGWWVEAPSRPLWRQYDVHMHICIRICPYTIQTSSLSHYDQAIPCFNIDVGGHSSR